MSSTRRTAAEIIAEALEHFDLAISHSQRDLSDLVVIVRQTVLVNLPPVVEALRAWKS